MREADAVLAETDAVLKTRKDALIAKHIEGRESFHELDYIFRETKFTNPAPREDVGENYLDLHQMALEKQSRDRQEQLKKNENPDGDFGNLLRWNNRMDKEFELDRMSPPK